MDELKKGDKVKIKEFDIDGVIEGIYDGRGSDLSYKITYKDNNGCLCYTWVTADELEIVN